jgi:hypothetical protein
MIDDMFVVVELDATLFPFCQTTYPELSEYVTAKWFHPVDSDVADMRPDRIFPFELVPFPTYNIGYVFDPVLPIHR